ncbi:MAG: ATP/GTP-binding protein [Hadesarchaea archaeon]|nr:ATP/GTP-binding protein [Hadesarchaea archaeon]
MSRPLNLIVLGTAGSGKSALTAAFGKWIEQNTDQKVAYINLDPGCDFVPFKPDFDVRDHFTISQIMRDENLGPNGAMVRASELLEQKAKEFSRRINKIKADIRLIDTPGQMEVFLFHGGPEMAKLMGDVTISVFLTDAEIAAKATGLVFTRLLGLSVGLRLGVPAVGVLNKMDLARDKLADIDRILADTELLEKLVVKEGSGVMIDLTLRLSKALPELLPAARVVKVSAKTGEGMRELYDIVHEVFCACGDLT